MPCLASTRSRQSLSSWDVPIVSLSSDFFPIIGVVRRLLFSRKWKSTERCCSSPSVIIEDVVMWLNLASERMSVPQLTDYANRCLVDRFSVLDRAARGRIHAVNEAGTQSSFAAREGYGRRISQSLSGPWSSFRPPSRRTGTPLRRRPWRQSRQYWVPRRSLGTGGCGGMWG
jgi:hypothetical protein